MKQAKNIKKFSVQSNHKANTSRLPTSQIESGNLSRGNLNFALEYFDIAVIWECSTYHMYIYICIYIYIYIICI